MDLQLKVVKQNCTLCECEEWFHKALFCWLLQSEIILSSTKQQPHTVSALREPLYVFISSSSDVNEAYSVTTTAKEMSSHANMNLCKWVTNSADLKEKWTENEMECAADPDSSGGLIFLLN